MRVRVAILAAVVVSIFVLVASVGAQGVAALSGELERRAVPPRVAFDARTPKRVCIGQEVRFAARASHSQNGSVTLTLLNPPPGLVFHPATGTGSATAEMRWVVPPGTPERVRLLFRAQSTPSGASTSFHLDVEVQSAGETLLTGDVTGDGIADVVGGANLADVGPVVNAGAVYVWEGGANPNATPFAELTIPAAAPGDRLGWAAGQAIHLVDVVGDATLDLVILAQLSDEGGVLDAGAVHVWQGGPGLFGGPPQATLAIPFAADGDQLGSSGIRFGDVTGDGIDDVVVGSSEADTSAVNAGAVYVWAGGSGLVGTPPPTATLTDSQAVAGDRLGFASGEGIQLGDVTGDSILDVVVGCQLADVALIANLGAVYVWEGGAGLTGLLDPDSILHAFSSGTDAAAGDQLGFAAGQGVQLADLTGDGRLDVVAAGQLSDVAGVPEVGAVLAWHGGPLILGGPPPDATFVRFSAMPGDQIGFSAGQGVILADVTGNGYLDVVAGSQLGDRDFPPQGDVGFVHVWAGGPTQTGTRDVSATLEGGSEPGDQLGSVAGQGIRVAELSNDGVLDVLAGAQHADTGSGSIGDTGALYIWEGGAQWNGGSQFGASVELSGGSTAGDRLGFCSGQGMQVEDVDGDGRLDVIAGAQLADFGNVVNSGAVYVFRTVGSFDSFPSNASGHVLSSSTDGDRLGLVGGPDGTGIQFADLDDDGYRDVVVGAQWADPMGTQDAGALLVLQGGPNFGFSEETLFVPGAMEDDRLGDARGPSIRFGDLDDDGRTDLLVAARFADPNGVVNCGALYAWSGDPQFFDGGSFQTTLRVQSPLVNDQLGQAAPGIQLADVTGDGVLDVLGGGELIDHGAVNTGALNLWTGGFSFTSGDVFETVTFAPLSSTAGDLLGL